MAQVIMRSWRSGLKKVSLTMLQYELLKIPLNEAKYNVDFLLNDQEVILEINDEVTAYKFYYEADKLGVNCELIKG